MVRVFVVLSGVMSQGSLIMDLTNSRSGWLIAWNVGPVFWRELFQFCSKSFWSDFGPVYFLIQACCNGLPQAFPWPLFLVYVSLLAFNWLNSSSPLRISSFSFCCLIFDLARFISQTIGLWYPVKTQQLAIFAGSNGFELLRIWNSAQAHKGAKQKDLIQIVVAAWLFIMIPITEKTLVFQKRKQEQNPTIRNGRTVLKGYYRPGKQSIWSRKPCF